MERESGGQEPTGDKEDGLVSHCRKLLALLFIVLFAFTASPARGDSLDDHLLIRVEIRTQRELLTMTGIGATPWNCRVGLGMQDFSVSPEQFEAVRRVGIRYNVLADNVQRLIDDEREANERARAEGGIAGGNWFAAYRTWSEVNDYIDELVALRPDLATKLVLGQTHENRTIYGIRITSPNGDNKPAVLFNGCQHAREWISVMVPMFIADRLVREYETVAAIRDLVDHVEFLIVPIVNPDGYEFTYAPGGNRLWRKNRRWNGGSTYGVDLNRNWDADWGGPHSTSTLPSSLLYIGPYVFSEPEVQAMRDFILARPNIVAHIDFHSYGQLILHPLGFTSDPVPDAPTLIGLGNQMKDAIFAVHGKNYPVGIPGALLYFASGLFPDWGYLARGILGYTVELRPIGNPGFILPPEEIIPTSEEAFEAAMRMAMWASLQVGCPADLNNDGTVDVLDLLAVLSAWGPCVSCATDINRDGVVDVLDLLALLSAWGPCAD